MADQERTMADGKWIPGKQADAPSRHDDTARPVPKESQKAPPSRENKGRVPKASTITFNELIKLLIFLLLFALVAYAMGKGMDPGALLDTVGKILGSFLGAGSAVIQFTAPSGQSSFFLCSMIGLLAFVRLYYYDRKRILYPWFHRI